MCCENIKSRTIAGFANFNSVMSFCKKKPVKWGSNMVALIPVIGTPIGIGRVALQGLFALSDACKGSLNVNGAKENKEKRARFKPIKLAQGLTEIIPFGAIVFWIGKGIYSGCTRCTSEKGSNGGIPKSGSSASGSTSTDNTSKSGSASVSTEDSSSASDSTSTGSVSGPESTTSQGVITISGELKNGRLNGKTALEMADFLKKQYNQNKLETIKLICPESDINELSVFCSEIVKELPKNWICNFIYFKESNDPKIIKMAGGW